MVKRKNDRRTNSNLETLHRKHRIEHANPTKIVCVIHTDIKNKSNSLQNKRGYKRTEYHYYIEIEENNKLYGIKNMEI